jgi:glycosyltransferase involved in cell wall biosynthesis
MRITICWTDISGYMGACWRALAASPGVELFVIAFKSNAIAAFDQSVMQGAPSRLLDPQERQDQELITRELLAHSPQVFLISGWAHPPYVAMARDPRLAAVRRVMTMDTPWRADLRQRLARWRLRSYFKIIDRVFVPGERSFEYARHLGFPVAQIRRGLYGCDFDRLSPIYDARLAAGDWPREFLYMGRYVDAKGLDILVRAYAAYRAAVTEPWPLICHGSGPLAHLLRGQPGIEDRGFVQPSDQPAVLQQAGAFVLASRYDPWPLVILESCASGLPVLCTDACGSSVELVRPHYNGWIAPPEDPAALAVGMRRVHQSHDRLPEFARAARELARPYSAQVWAQRVVEMAGELIDGDGAHP